MKVFENKRIFNKIVIVLLVLTVFSFCFSGKVHASDSIGGKLLNPIMTLFVSLGDGVMTLLQKIVLHMDNSLIELDTATSFWAKFIVIAAAIVVVSVILIATVMSAGAAGAAIAGIAAALKGAATIAITIGLTTITFPITTALVEGVLPDTFILPIYQITPQEIFSNKIPLLDVDFFSPSQAIELEDGKQMKSTAEELRSTISNWYTILRDISLVALLSVLVYIGIRIIISSTSNDKAKYKQMLMDWIVAICLLFVMQYIMAFSNLIVKKVIEIIDTTQVSASDETGITEPEVFLINEKKYVDKAYKSLVGDEGENSPYYNYFTDDQGNPSGESSTVLVWPAENFMQQARIKLQLLSDSKETYIAIGWKLIYVVLVIFTLIFIVTYVKRVIYMAFLTIIAPLVALTYPIDRINDGKAQAFNAWFKEYIFNLLIQPMHLIIYTVLVGSAMEFASKNIIYVIVALFFMVPAEKLIRSFFGFEKAKTPGLLAGPAGAALMMTGMNKLLGKSSNSKSSSSSSSGKQDTSDKQDKSNLRFNDKFDKAGVMLGKGESDSSPKGMDDNQENNIDNNDDTININGNDNNNNNQLNNIRNQQDNNNQDKDNSNNTETQPQFWEDRAMAALRQKGGQISEGIKQKGSQISQNAKQKMNDTAIKFNDTTVGRGMNKIGRGVSSVAKAPIRGARALNKNSRFVNKGVKLAKAGAVGARHYAHRKLENVGQKIQNSHPVRKGVNIAGGLAMGTAGAILGGVSGDSNKAAQYAMTGAMGGYKAAGGITSRFGNSRS